MEKKEEGACKRSDDKDEEALSKLLKLLFDRITRDEMSVLQEKEKGESVYMSKLPHTLEVGWYAYKRCRSTMDKEERRRITLKSFYDCLSGDGMSELCRTMADLTLGN